MFVIDKKKKRKKEMPHNNIIKCWQCNFFFIQEVKKEGNAETEQCPAYSAQDVYKHARQRHTRLSQYLHTLSQHGDTETGSQTEFQSLNLNFRLVYTRNKPQDISQQDTEMCKLAERSPDT